MKPESEEAATVPDEAESATSKMHAPGSMLARERVRRGLSIGQAAEGLHLDPWIIEAIEANKFLALGAPVYAKGYLRKYALLLELAPEVVVARYEALTDTLPVPTAVPVNTTAPPRRPKWPKYVGRGGLAAAIIALGALALEYVGPALSGLSNAPSPIVASKETFVDGSAAPKAASVNPPPTLAAAGASVRVKLEFTAPSWTEIYDAAGRRLFYGIAEAREVHTVAGAPPLEVTIGVASAVSVHVNDRSVVVPRRANRDSARFVVDADGSVR